MPTKRVKPVKPAAKIPKPKPPKESPAERKAQKSKALARENRIAAGIIAGESVATLARTEGVSRSYASTIANGSTVTQIIGELLREEAELVGTLFRKSLSAIQDALRAERFVVIDKVLTPLGADHFARLTAAKRAMEFIVAGRMNPKQDDESGDKPLTASEFKKLLAEHAGKK